jgi:hypothetical protein
MSVNIKNKIKNFKNISIFPLNFASSNKSTFKQTQTGATVSLNGKDYKDFFIHTGNYVVYMDRFFEGKFSGKDFLIKRTAISKV